MVVVKMGKRSLKITKFVIWCRQLSAEIIFSIFLFYAQIVDSGVIRVKSRRLFYNITLTLFRYLQNMNEVTSIIESQLGSFASYSASVLKINPHNRQQ